MTRYIDMGTKGKANAWTREYQENEAAAWAQMLTDPSNVEFCAIWRAASDRLDKQLRLTAHD